jgi:hypothetical protein
MIKTSSYRTNEGYIPRVGDHVTTFALPSNAIPGVVIADNDPAAPVIAYPHLGHISVCSAAAVSLVRRGSPAEAREAITATAKEWADRAGVQS